MFVRKISNQPTQPIGCSGLVGKPLLSLEDGTGFTQHGIMLTEGVQVRLRTGFPGCHHVYYVTYGTAVVKIRGYVCRVTQNTLIALREDIEALCIPKEPLHLLVIHPLRDEAVITDRYIIRQLNDVVGTPGDNDIKIGRSRRILVKDDGFNISINDALFYAYKTVPIQCLKHRLASYFVQGAGKLIWDDSDGKSHDFSCNREEPESWTMVSFDFNPCTIKTTDICCLVSVHHPALSEREHESYETAET